MEWGGFNFSASMVVVATCASEGSLLWLFDRIIHLIHTFYVCPSGFGRLVGELCETKVFYSKKNTLTL